MASASASTRPPNSPSWRFLARSSQMPCTNPPIINQPLTLSGKETSDERGSTSRGVKSVSAREGRWTCQKCGKCLKSANDSEIEEHFENCEEWSERSELAINHDKGGAAEEENQQEFELLQMHSNKDRGFFRTFGYTLGKGGRRSVGELELGKKFAEGGQAEIFNAKVTWWNEEWNEIDLRDGIKWVLKVFKKDTLLSHLKSQLPPGYMRYRAEERKRWGNGKPHGIRYFCSITYATLLKDGRFAFLMVKEDRDLRSLINENMHHDNPKNTGPFVNEDAEMIMYRIALGVEWMHKHDIIHRDLKAANVLVTRRESTKEWLTYIADFESSIGVVGTRFWRAPEILKACKEKNVSKKPKLFTKKSDIYSYGMTCYEILTGRSPFSGHERNDYDLVLKGNRPKVPNYVEGWARDLLNWCWEPHPKDRPSIKDILERLENKSNRVKKYKKRLEAMKKAQSTSIVGHLKQYFLP